VCPYGCSHTNQAADDPQAANTKFKLKDVNPENKIKKYSDSQAMMASSELSSKHAEHQNAVEPEDEEINEEDLIKEDQSEVDSDWSRADPSKISEKPVPENELSNSDKFFGADEMFEQQSKLPVVSAAVSAVLSLTGNNRALANRQVRLKDAKGRITIRENRPARSYYQGMRH